VNVHIAVPGDTIVDIAKVYNVDLDALEGLNPQIMDLSTLLPRDPRGRPRKLIDKGIQRHRRFALDVL
jgi:hypothetical protein